MDQGTTVAVLRLEPAARMWGLWVTFCGVSAIGSTALADFPGYKIAAMSLLGVALVALGLNLALVRLRFGPTGVRYGAFVMREIPRHEIVDVAIRETSGMSKGRIRLALDLGDQGEIQFKRLQRWDTPSNRLRSDRDRVAMASALGI